MKTGFAELPRAAPVATLPLPLPAFAAASAVAALSLLPLAFIFWAAAETGLVASWALIFRPRVGEIFVNTVLLEAIALPLGVALAVALAWLTERSDLPAARLWAWLAIVPLAIPAFVHGYAWISLFPRFEGLDAAVCLSIAAYLPFIYLPVAAAFRRLDPAIEDVAASLGNPPWRVFVRVVLPQLRPAIAGGALLVALHLLAEYGLYVMLRFDTFTTAIVDQFQSASSGPAASMLAAVLVVCCAAVLAGESALRGGSRYARVGSGAPRVPARVKLGLWKYPALLLPASFAAIAIGVPFVTLAKWLVAGGAAVWRDAALVQAFVSTAGLAFAGALAATIAAAPAAWLSVRHPGRAARVLEACHYYTGALPGVVVALALVAVTVHFASIYQSAGTAILAYVLLFLQRTLASLRAGIAQVPVELEWAAASLGRTPFNATLAVTLRLAAPSAAAAFALAALAITTELTATLMLAPNGTRTLATEFWSLASEIDYVRAAPYATLMVVLSLPMTLWLQAHSKRAAGR